MAECAKSRFCTKIEEIDDGESVMVEAKDFDLSQPEHLRYSSLLGKNYVVEKVKHSTSTSYLIDFEDGGCSLIAKMKVRRANPSLEDTEDTRSDKADEISFQIVKDVNTAVKTNSVFQSTTTLSADYITVSSHQTQTLMCYQQLVLQKYLSHQHHMYQTVYPYQNQMLLFYKPIMLMISLDHPILVPQILCLYHLQILSTLC